MEVYFWSGLRVANDSGVPPVIKVTFPPRPENATAIDAVQEANETFYNILALSVGITGMVYHFFFLKSAYHSRRVSFIAGAVLLLAMVVFFWYRNRQAERARLRYLRKCLSVNAEDAPNGDCAPGEQLRPIFRPPSLPPSNNNTIRQPPGYKESLMEV